MVVMSILFIPAVLLLDLMHQIAIVRIRWAQDGVFLEMVMEEGEVQLEKIVGIDWKA